MRRLLPLVAVLFLAPLAAHAQQDLTPPTLVDFSFAPLAADTGPADVVVQWCATSRDDLSGLYSLRVYIINDGLPDHQLGINYFSAGTLQSTVCNQAVLPRGSQYADYLIMVIVSDRVFLDGSYLDTAAFWGSPPNPYQDLCSIGPCHFTNRPGNGLDDTDGDGIPDDADNCIYVSNSDQADGDFDLAGNTCDNCPSIGNYGQFDQDSDGVGDSCDSCVAIPNPRAPAGWLASNPWAVLTGGQRDDDFDGFGNKCDAKFPGSLGTLVGSADLTQFRASNGKNRTGMNCGTGGLLPCAIFDLDESALLVGTPDLSRFRLLNGKAPGPKCATCPLTCEAGALRSCDQ